MKPQKSILYGIHSVQEALLADRRKIDRLYIVNDKPQRIARIVAHARLKKISIERVTGNQLTSLVRSDSHQGIGARSGGYPYVDVNRILSQNTRTLVLIMDGIVDPRNAGALIRTAACVGVTGILLPKDRSVSVTPFVSSASAGAVEHIELARVTNVSRVISQLKAKGIWIAGLDASVNHSLFEVDLTGPLALVVGSEQKGIRPLVKKKCDYLLSIPQKNHIDSLNVSVAGAVALYEAFRQRQAPTGSTLR